MLNFEFGDIFPFLAYIQYETILDFYSRCTRIGTFEVRDLTHVAFNESDYRSPCSQLHSLAMRTVSWLIALRRQVNCIKIKLHVEMISEPMDHSPFKLNFHFLQKKSKSFTTANIPLEIRHLNPSENFPIECSAAKSL